MVIHRKSEYKSINIPPEYLTCKGIYKLTCINNNRYYIGSTKDKRGFLGRFYRHLEDLKKNKHFNIILQNCYNKYGPDSIEMSIIEKTPSHYNLDQIHCVEQRIINENKNDKLIMNISDKVGGGNHEGMSKYHPLKTVIMSLLEKEKKSYMEIVRILQNSFGIRSHWSSIRTYYLKHCKGAFKKSKYSDYKYFIKNEREKGISYREVTDKLRALNNVCEFTVGGLVEFCLENGIKGPKKVIRKRLILLPYKEFISELIKKNTKIPQIIVELKNKYNLKCSDPTVYSFIKRHVLC